MGISSALRSQGDSERLLSGLLKPYNLQNLQKVHVPKVDGADSCSGILVSDMSLFTVDFLRGNVCIISNAYTLIENDQQTRDHLPSTSTPAPGNAHR